MTCLCTCVTKVSGQLSHEARMRVLEGIWFRVRVRASNEVAPIPKPSLRSPLLFEVEAWWDGGNCGV